MEKKPLRNDLFLYDLAIRVLAFWTTILFSLLFFTGARANPNTEGPNKKNAIEVATQLPEIKSDKR